MAKVVKERQTFHCTVNTEGPSNTKRAKIPAGVVAALGALKGQLIEIVTENGQIVGGRVVKGTEARKVKNESLYSQSRVVAKKTTKTPKKKVTTAKKTVTKKAPAKKVTTKKKATPKRTVKVSPKKKVVKKVVRKKK